MNEESTVITRREGAVAIVIVDGPSVRNALSGPTLSVLCQRLREAEHEPGVRVVVPTFGSRLEAGGLRPEAPNRASSTNRSPHFR